MKIYHFACLFIVFAVSVAVITDIHLSKSNYYERMNTRIETCLDEAVNAAAWELRAAGTVFDSYTESRVISSFYNSFSAAMGIMDMPEKERVTGKFIPLIIITLKDGYYIFRYEPTEEAKEPYDNYRREGIFYTGNEPNETSVAVYLLEYYGMGLYKKEYRISVSGVEEIEGSGN